MHHPLCPRLGAKGRRRNAISSGIPEFRCASGARSDIPLAVASGHQRVDCCCLFVNNEVNRFANIKQCTSKYCIHSSSYSNVA